MPDPRSCRSEVGEHLVVTRYDTVRELRPDTLAPTFGEQQLRELVRLENVWWNLGVRPRYLVATAEGEPAGLLPVYPARGRHYAGWQPTHLFPDADAPQRWRRGVLIGSDATAGNALTGEPDVMAALVRAAVAFAAEQQPDYICLPLLDDDQHAAALGAAPDGFVASERGEAVIPLTFDSFEDYVRQLPSRRTAIRRERRQFLAADLSLRSMPLGEVASELGGLLSQVENKYGDTSSTPHTEERYLRSIAAAMGGAGSALVTYDGDRMVAGSVVWDLREEWRVRCWGCDLGHPAVRRHYQYFNLMFYEPLLRARAAGAQRLLVGGGSLAAKIIRGAQVSRRRSIAWETPADSR